MKITKIVSDHTGKELKDHIILSVEKPGFTICLPDGSVTNRAIFDLEESEVALVMKKLVYKPVVVPGRLP